MPKAPPRLDENDPIHRFAARLRQLRFTAGDPPLQSLASRMYCHHSTVSAYLNGGRLPSPGRLDKFVSACHGDPAEWRRLLAETRERSGTDRLTGERIGFSLSGGIDFSSPWPKGRVERDLVDQRIAILDAARQESAEMRQHSVAGGEGDEAGASSIADFSMQEESRRSPLMIGLLGCTLSGKSTYLAALDIASARAGGGWSMVGVDEGSEDFLEESTYSLAAEKRFPEGTQVDSIYSWMLSKDAGAAPEEGKPPQPEYTRILLDVSDRPGGFYQYGIDREPIDGVPDESGVDQDLDHLVGSDGLILQFDPIREQYEGDNYLYFQRVLRLLASRWHGNRLPMPHYVALCVTKFDDPEIFQRAILGGHVSVVDLATGSPGVKGDRAQMFFHDLISQPGNADLAMSLLHYYFRPERIRCFVVSSIGFYISPSTNKFNIADFENVIDTDTGPTRIRGNIYPLNVLEPIM